MISPMKHAPGAGSLSRQPAPTRSIAAIGAGARAEASSSRPWFPKSGDWRALGAPVHNAGKSSTRTRVIGSIARPPAPERHSMTTRGRDRVCRHLPKPWPRCSASGAALPSLAPPEPTPSIAGPASAPSAACPAPSGDGRPERVSGAQNAASLSRLPRSASSIAVTAAHAGRTESVTTVTLW